MSERQEPASIADALHKLRSALARVQGEVELLELDGVPATRMLEGLQRAFEHLSALEEQSHVARDSDRQSRRGSLGAVTVIDDDDRLAELTAERLRRRGVTASHASKLNETMGLPQSAILVVDLGVLLGASANDIKRLGMRKFIVVSGQVSGDGQLRARTLGASMFLTKPVSLDDLITAIGQMQAAQE